MEKKKRKGLVWIIIIALVAAGVVLYLMFGRTAKQLQMTTKAATEGVVEITVMATGTLQPVDKVDVGTQVSGIVEEIHVDFNSVVKKGDLLAVLDTKTLKEKVTQAQASLASAQADLKYAQTNYNRTQDLYKANAATQVALEDAENSLQRAETSLVNAEANLSQAGQNLKYAYITSPIDGVVLERAVEEGQTVASSFNTPTLFAIARDLTKMQVEAAVDEADIGKVKEGQKVTFNVDAYSTDTFAGEVKQVRIQPVVTSNVVTYTVIIEAPNPDLKLFPGMTANVYIVNESQEGVVVPVEAVYFTMGNDVAKELGVRHQDLEAVNKRKTQLWVRSGDRWELRDVTAGIQDGVNIVVREGLGIGDEVILSASVEKVSNDRGTATRNPLMPGGPRRR